MPSRMQTTINANFERFRTDYNPIRARASVRDG